MWQDILKIGYIPADAKDRGEDKTKEAEECSICGKSFPSLKELIHHQSEEHNDMDPPENAPVDMSGVGRTSLIDRAKRANKDDPRMGSGKR
jgi:hypothetical protein